MTEAEIFPHVSVVVPLYNEEDNVGPLVDAVHQAMSGTGWPWELILVDDGSRDDDVLGNAQHHQFGADLSLAGGGHEPDL